ncbi:hypothetical protein BOV89_07785 [Solemya velum gill symbiont]|uniref:hypothetical protein n=1 Tax=Solemya velum gill symbiont TaxID=2340 RepID=UPI000997686D|nr:hypothetical protein [Solemya velum gill symbiont]OOY37291.1 hypothetical protein BOV89_07785 [Solemya velum gill symbiont]
MKKLTAVAILTLLAQVNVQANEYDDFANSLAREMADRIMQQQKQPEIVNSSTNNVIDRTTSGIYLEEIDGNIIFKVDKNGMSEKEAQFKSELAGLMQKCSTTGKGDPDLCEVTEAVISEYHEFQKEKKASYKQQLITFIAFTLAFIIYSFMRRRKLSGEV